MSFISELSERRALYANPEQATTQAKSLNLLSAGIYTEEERFIFELLQNAVDAFTDERDTLRIKISCINNYLVFQHNGEAFSKRDVEGLCDVGNGNKSSDKKKIGYKGIGFKSVFVHAKKSQSIVVNFVSHSIKSTGIIIGIVIGAKRQTDRKF